MKPYSFHSAYTGFRYDIVGTRKSDGAITLDFTATRKEVSALPTIAVHLPSEAPTGFTGSFSHDYNSIVCSVPDGLTGVLDVESETILIENRTGLAALQFHWSITVYGSAGTAALTISEYPSDSRDADTARLIPACFWPDGTVFKELYVAPPQIKRGDTATLYATLSTNRDITYTLYYTKDGTTELQVVDNEELRSHFSPNDDPAHLSYPMDNITSSTTAFLLQAGYQSETQELVASLLETDGDLTTGNLTITGSTQAMDYIPQNNTLENGIKYTTPTDGFLFCSVTTLNQNTDASLAVTLTPPNGGQPECHSVTSRQTSDANSCNLTLPVKNGSLLEFSTPQKSIANSLIEWYPLGSGDLAPLEKE